MKKESITIDEIADWLDSRSDFTLEKKALEHISGLGYDIQHGETSPTISLFYTAKDRIGTKSDNKKRFRPKIGSSDFKNILIWHYFLTHKKKQLKTLKLPVI